MIDCTFKVLKFNLKLWCDFKQDTGTLIQDVLMKLEDTQIESL